MMVVAADQVSGECVCVIDLSDGDECFCFVDEDIPPSRTGCEDNGYLTERLLGISNTGQGKGWIFLFFIGFVQ